MSEFTPKQIVEELDKYIIGQDKAKKSVAIALRNRYRRKLLSDDLREEVIPKNILMIGPTGVGKTEIARRLAQIANAPFIKVEATKFTEVGYVGRDVDSMIRDLVQLAIRMVEAEKIAEVKDKAKEQAVERILDIMQPLQPKSASASAKKHVEAAYEMMSQIFGGKPKPEEPEMQSEPEKDESLDQDDIDRRTRIREKLRKQIVEGVIDDTIIEIETEESSMPMIQFLASQSGEDMSDMKNMLGPLTPKRTKKRKVTIKEAKEILQHEEAQNLVDHDQIVREAIESTEESGIIFIDELDKVASREKDGGSGPQVSREGVQRDILPIIEGSTVSTKHGPVKTDHILFIAAGAFHVSKPSDLIPELQGRLPIRVELDNLTTDDFKRILTEPKNALIKQYTALLATEGVQLVFTDDAVTELAVMAEEVNSQMENIGARRLHTIMEKLLEEVSFTASDISGTTLTIDAAYVREKLEDIVKSEDISRYIL